MNTDILKVYEEPLKQSKYGNFIYLNYIHISSVNAELI